MKIKIPLIDSKLNLDRRFFTTVVPAVAVMVIVGIVDAAIKEVGKGLMNTVVEGGFQGIRFLKNNFDS